EVQLVRRDDAGHDHDLGRVRLEPPRRAAAGDGGRRAPGRGRHPDPGVGHGLDARDRRAGGEVMSGLPKADPATERWMDEIRVAALSPKVGRAMDAALAFIDAKFDP